MPSTLARAPPGSDRQADPSFMLSDLLEARADLAHLGLELAFGDCA
jgi:hypothetical protein